MKRALESTLAGLAALTVALTVVLAHVPSEAAVTSVREAPQRPAVAVKIVGMSAPSNLWDQRIREVGRCGLKARRIYANLDPSGTSQSALIEQSVKDGMMPVISYKVPNVQTLIAGGYDTWLEKTRTYLGGLGVKVTATFWHEPYGDMAPRDFRAGSRKFLAGMQAPGIAVGPILNGWLLDNKVADFASFTSPSLLRKWNFVAVDSYQNGTAANPGDLLPGRAVPLLAAWMDRQGFPNKRIGLGEYNGHTGAAIRSAGRAILSTPEVWFALAWNSDTDTYSPLAGDRITAFQRTKADARAKGRC